MSKRSSKKWLRESIAVIDNAIEDLNEMYPHRKERTRIVWGFANKQDEEVFGIDAAEHCDSGELLSRHQEGLLSHNGEDYELSLYHHIDSRRPDWCQIDLAFSSLPETATEEFLRFPMHDIQTMYNLLNHLEDCVQLRLSPANRAGSAIAAMGVKTTVPIEALTGRVFGDALSRLSLSRESAWGWLFHGEGDDQWDAAREWFPNDSDE